MTPVKNGRWTHFSFPVFVEAQKGLRTEGLQAKEPRWEQLHAAAKQKQQRLAEKRLLQELEEEEWKLVVVVGTLQVIFDCFLLKFS